MKTYITTVATANSYQHYLPLYTYVLRKEYPEYLVKTFVLGELDDITEQAFDVLRDNNIDFDPPITRLFRDIPLKKTSISNCLRFLIPESYFPGYKRIIYTDVDLLLFRHSQTLLKWHEKQMERIRSCYAGHHGPWLHRRRPEICPGGWKGKFERVSGGFFMVTPQWFKVTKKQRKNYLKKIKAEKYGGYRECDEVMLGNIIRKSHLPLPPFGFPNVHRGVHLGDFKPSMKKRYNSKKKMKRHLNTKNVRKFWKLEKDKIWKQLLEVLSVDQQLMESLDICRKVLKKRAK